MNIQKLEKHYNALNNLHNSANALMPILQKYVSENGIQFKKDGSFTKRTNDELKALIQPFVVKGNDWSIQIFIDCQYNYTKYIDFKIGFCIGDSWDYIIETYPLCDKTGLVTTNLEYQPKQIYKLEDFVVALEGIYEKKQQIDKLKYELSTLETEFVLKNRYF